MSGVLIVEDEFIIASSLRKLLELSGIDVCGIASTGEMAIQMAIEHTPSVILLDVCLPGNINGLEAAIEIRKHIETDFIVISGNPTDQIGTVASAVGAIAVVAKPFRIAKIIDLIKEADGARLSDGG